MLNHSNSSLRLKRLLTLKNFLLMYNKLGFMFRFSGDAAISAQAELRLLISKISLFLSGEFGIHFFGETGRVFVNGENSSKWHPGNGGGVWLSFINRSFNTSFTVALSTEDTAFYLRARMECR